MNPTIWIGIVVVILYSIVRGVINSWLWRKASAKADKLVTTKYDCLGSLSTSQKDKFRHSVRFSEIRYAKKTSTITFIICMIAIIGYVFFFSGIFLVTNIHGVAQAIITSSCFIALVALSIIMRSVEKSYADASISHHYLNIIYQLESGEENWSTSQFRNDISSSLEYLARSQEIYMGRQLHSRDRATQSWLVEEGASMANFVRDLKTWVLLPTRDTYYHLLNQIRNDFISVLLTDWSNVGRAKERGFGTKQGIAKQFISQTIAILVAPAVLTAVQFSPWPLTGKPETAAVAFVALLVVIGVGSVVDPKFISRVKVVLPLVKGGS